MKHTKLKKGLCLSSCLLISLLFLSLVGCGNRGTGLSENEDYLNHLENNELRGIVIDSHYYLLPAPLQSFIDNGWVVQEDVLAEEYINDIATIDLPVETYMKLRLVKDDLELNITVINPLEEEINVLDGSVTEVSTRRVEKDQIVVIGGITGNTSRRDVSDLLESLNVDFTGGSGDRTFVARNREGEYREELWISFHMGDGVATDFRLTLNPMGAARVNFTRHRALSSEDRLAVQEEMEATFMADASYLEGEFAGLYEFVLTHADGETESRHSTMLRIIDGNGDSAIININDLTVDEERFFDLRFGDEIKVYFDPETGGRVITLYDEEVPHARAVVLVINGEVYSRYRD